MNTLILTIDPGSRSWGVSVFSGNTFHASFIKNLSAKDLPATRLPQTRKVFRFLCRRYCPDILVFKKPQKSWLKQSNHLSAVYVELRRLARSEGMQIVEFMPEEMRDGLCGNTRATRDELLLAIRRFDYDLGEWLIGEKEKVDRFRWSRLMTSAALGVCFLKDEKEKVHGSDP